jgi:hypothetical protein
MFIIKMELKEIGVIHLIHDTDNWQARTILDICVPQYPGEGLRILVELIMCKMTTCTGHILQRNCLLKCVLQVKIEGITRCRRRCKQLLGDLKAKKST